MALMLSFQVSFTILKSSALHLRLCLKDQISVLGISLAQFPAQFNAASREVQQISTNKMKESLICWKWEMLSEPQLDKLVKVSITSKENLLPLE
jgi:hypothetical protein